MSLTFAKGRRNVTPSLHFLCLFRDACKTVRFTLTIGKRRKKREYDNRDFPNLPILVILYVF